MSALIDEFKKDHSEIIDTLKEIKELGVLSEEGQAKLISAKESLLEHLRKEDELLYPVLKKEAEHNEKLNYYTTLTNKEILLITQQFQAQLMDLKISNLKKLQ